MSFAPGWRTNARGPWGGRADFRGLIQTDALGLQSRTVINRGQIGWVIFRSPGGYSNSALTGITRDSALAPLAGCRVDLCQGNIIKQSITSDGSGNFTFLNPGSGPFFLVAYKPGSPDVAGTTVNTLQPAVI